MAVEDYLGNDKGCVLGPYHPDELGARQRALQTLTATGRDVWLIQAISYQDAQRKLSRMLESRTS